MIPALSGTAPAGVRVLVATRPVDFRRGADGLAAMVQSILQQDPFSGTVFVFRSKRADRVKLLVYDGTGVRRHRSGADLEATGRRHVQMAAGQRRGNAAVRGAARLYVRSCMLMPLLVRLTGPQIEMADGVVSQVPDAVNDGGRILEQVRAAGLPIHEEALLP